MAEIHISSSRGIIWGNHICPPERVVEVLGCGARYENGELTFDKIKIINRIDEEYVLNMENKVIPLTAFFSEFDEEIV